MFILSKLGWLFVTPSNLLGILALVGGLLCFSTRDSRARTGRWVATGATLTLLCLGLLPAGTWLLAPLEDRFPAPADDGRPLVGAIVLGGAVLPSVSFNRRQLVTGDAGERVIALADLARRQPGLRLIFSGGSAAVIGTEAAEAAALARFGGVLGLEPARVTYERTSRTTYENARDTKPLLPPDTDGRWLLVTSAWHMPRAVGTFRAAGIEVVPYPVDYRTGPSEGFWKPEGSLAGGLDRVDTALREWLGLLVYWLTGRSDALFPAPTR